MFNVETFWNGIWSAEEHLSFGSKEEAIAGAAEHVDPELAWRVVAAGIIVAHS